MATNPYESPENESELPKVQERRSGCSYPFIAVISILALLAALFVLPMRRCAREAARRMQCTNHLKQISLALRNYTDTYGSLPPAYTVDADGKPLHSWRTLLLPFLENKPLYDRIDFSKPWDDPVNQFAMKEYPAMFRCPSAHLQRGETTYFAVVAPGGCFKPGKSTPLAAITDGTSRTIAVVEVLEKYAAHWMSPTDATEAMIVGRKADDKFVHVQGTMALFLDGHTALLKKETPPEALRALISIDGDDNKVAEKF